MTTYTPREHAPDSERIALTEAAVCDLHARLLGGVGTPGELALMKRETRSLRKEVNAIKGWQWAERGAIAAVVFVAKLWPLIKGH